MKSKDEKTDEELAGLFLDNLSELSYFEQLIGRYEAKLARYVRSLGVEQNLADDVVQDSFVKAYRNIRSYNPKKGKWSSWIYRICHNTAMDYFKRAKKDLTVDTDEWWDGISVPEKITEELDLKLNKEKLMGSIMELDIKLREPLVLNYVYGKSYKEVGDILRMPVATVSTRIRRAKLKLREVLEDPSDVKLKGK